MKNELTKSNPTNSVTLLSMEKAPKTEKILAYIKNTELKFYPIYFDTTSKKWLLEIDKSEAKEEDLAGWLPLIKYMDTVMFPNDIAIQEARIKYGIQIPKLIDANIPLFKATKGSAAYDLVATEDFLLGPGEREVFWTGLKLSLPEGIHAKICSRSGLALNMGIAVLNAPGIIDSDYTKEVGVILINHSKSFVKISAGDKIAQILFEGPGIENCKFSDKFVTLSEERDGGFGSTGK